MPSKLGKGSLWGNPHQTSGVVPITAGQLIRAWTKAGKPECYREGDEGAVDDAISIFRLANAGREGITRGKLAKNLRSLVTKFDKVFEMIGETGGKIPASQEIKHNWTLPLQFIELIDQTWDGNAQPFDWRLGFDFETTALSIEEALHRSLQGAVYLREMTRVTADNLEARRKRYEPNKAQDELVLRLILIFEARARVRATVTVDPFATDPSQQRRSSAAEFIRSLLRGVNSYLGGQFPPELSSQANRHSKNLGWMSDSQSMTSVLKDLCRPSRIENLIDRFNRIDEPPGQYAENMRVKVLGPIQRGEVTEIRFLNSVALPFCLDDPNPD